MLNILIESFCPSLLDMSSMDWLHILSVKHRDLADTTTPWYSRALRATVVRFEGWCVPMLCSREDESQCIKRGYAVFCIYPGLAQDLKYSHMICVETLGSYPYTEVTSLGIWIRTIWITTVPPAGGYMISQLWSLNFKQLMICHE